MGSACIHFDLTRRKDFRSMVCNERFFFLEFISVNMDPSAINQVDVDRLQHVWDLIQQTHTLCEVLRTLVASMKTDTVEISTRSLDMLHERIHRQKKSKPR